MRSRPVSLFCARLIGPCEHEWRFVTANYYRLSGGMGPIACGCSDNAYPMSSILDRDNLLKAFERLPSDDARLKALRVIGDTKNRLSYLAAAVLLSLTRMSREELDGLDWERWWRERQRVFTVCTDQDKARAIVDEYYETHEAELEGCAHKIYDSLFLRVAEAYDHPLVVPTEIAR